MPLTMSPLTGPSSGASTSASATPSPRCSGLWDKDNDCIHVHAAIRVADQLPLQHAAAMKPIGGNVPVAWPQDGTAREKQRRDPGGQLQEARPVDAPDHATWPDGGISTEAGILEMQERMSTGRFKVARTCPCGGRSSGSTTARMADRQGARRPDVGHPDIVMMAKRFARTVMLGPQAKAGATPDRWPGT
jgi:hypothetical protein